MSVFSYCHVQYTQEHLSPVGAASLSRSFALKPRAMQPGDQASSLALRQPLSRSAHLGSAGLSAGASGRGSLREGQSFGQQAPSYGNRQGGMASAWTQPAFTAIYTVSVVRVVAANCVSCAVAWYVLGVSKRVVLTT